MQIGDLVFAPLFRSKPYDLHLARITGFQKDLGTISFEFLREALGESSDVPQKIFRAPHCISGSSNKQYPLQKNDTCHVPLPSEETFQELVRLRCLLKKEYGVDQYSRSDDADEVSENKSIAK